MARKGEALPTSFVFDVATKAITDQTMLAALQFDKDMARVSAPVNSIMEPKLYQLYIDDLRK